MGAQGQTIGNIDYDAWAKVLDANTMGPMRVAEAFVDNVARSERKTIVTLTSGMGSISDNTSGGAFAYRSSKAAVNMVDMGGPRATLSPAESVSRLRRLIDSLGPVQSGKFFNHDGREYAW